MSVREKKTVTAFDIINTACRILGIFHTIAVGGKKKQNKNNPTQTQIA